MMRFLLTAAERLLGVLLPVAAITAVALFALTATGTVRFVPVLSGSMAPHAPKGSLAVVTPAPAQDITAGDVIIFTAPDGTRRRVIHRVVHRYGPEESHTIEDWAPDKLFLTTKGDNNPSPDPWILVLGEATVWREHTVIPAVGWPLIGLSDPTIRVVAFGAGGAALSIWALVHIWRRPDPATPGSEPGDVASSTTDDPADGPASTDHPIDRTARATMDASA